MNHETSGKKSAVRLSFPPFSWGKGLTLIGQAVNTIIPAILPWAAWPIRGIPFPHENGGELSLTALFDEIEISP